MTVAASLNGAAHVVNALGPVEGPGSGGHKRINALSDRIHPRGHRVFEGAFDPSDPPKAISERFVRMMPGSGKILPPGDFRPWDEIDAWARELAHEIDQIAEIPTPA